uniref:Uncharacterized protein n=1 Tax=Periophthalmus magnuspinnatus TaxID=409849 RepID=A0A3B3ZEQ0_9GOBI
EWGTRSLNKISGLAWSILQLANETESGLTLVNAEMVAIRTAVIQPRLVLDILLAEKGGVCKLINCTARLFIEQPTLLTRARPLRVHTLTHFPVHSPNALHRNNNRNQH